MSTFASLFLYISTVLFSVDLWAVSRHHCHFYTRPIKHHNHLCWYHYFQYIPLWQLYTQYTVFEFYIYIYFLGIYYLNLRKEEHSLKENILVSQSNKIMHVWMYFFIKIIKKKKRKHNRIWFIYNQSWHCFLRSLAGMMVKNTFEFIVPNTPGHISQLPAVNGRSERHFFLLFLKHKKLK